ncbi:MAG: Unknown protein, partial [uncultured Thiotrichaceae bacterium]
DKLGHALNCIKCDAGEPKDEL